jgi:hypothetical protein
MVMSLIYKFKRKEGKIIQLVVYYLYELELLRLLLFERREN